MADEFLTVAEVGRLLKLNQQTVRNWIDRGSLSAIRVGRRVRIRRADLDALIDAGQTIRPEHDDAAAFWSGDAIPDQIVEP